MLEIHVFEIHVFQTLHSAGCQGTEGARRNNKKKENKIA